ncbi:U3 small nucleolar RNA-associated protein 4 [Rhizophlyctis rosea]|nr:U3 small nucleolar RNA-associated protein 4 [Rhizophlyctis rosea]
MDEDDTPESRAQHLKHLHSLPPRLFSASLDGRIIEWDITSLHPKQTLESNGGAIWCMVPNAAHTRLAVGCEDGYVRVYDVADGKLEFSRAFAKQEGRVMSLAWHSGVRGGEEFIVAGGADGVIRKFDVGTGKVLRRMVVDRVRGGDETIVWDLVVLKDGTIVAGDSLGNVSFWDSETGVVSRTLKAHEADVLCLATNKEGTEIFSSGVDRKVVRLSLLQQKKASGPKRPKEWVISGQKRYHSHDVRALALIEERPFDALISGGIDTNLIITQPVSDFPNVKHQRMPLFPHRSVISLARQARLLMCQFSDHVKVWRLAKPHLPDVALATKKQFEQLDFRKEELLFEIKPKCSTNLCASAISQCGRWIAVSDGECVKLFGTTIMAKEQTYTIRKIRTFPSPSLLPPASTLLFTPDSSRLIVAGTDSVIYIVDITQAESGTFSVEARFTDHAGLDEDGGRVEGREGEGKELVYYLAVSWDGQWLGSGDLKGRVKVWNLDTLMHHATPPHFTSQPTSLTFNPTTPTLIITCASNEFYFFDCEEGRLNDWSRENSHRLPLRWVLRKNLTMGATVGESKPGVVCLWGSETVCFVDLEKPIGDPDAAIQRDHKTAIALRFGPRNKRAKKLERERKRKEAWQRKQSAAKSGSEAEVGKGEEEKEGDGEIDAMITSSDERDGGKAGGVNGVSKVNGKGKGNGTSAAGGADSDGVILITSDEEDSSDDDDHPPTTNNLDHENHLETASEHSSFVEDIPPSTTLGKRSHPSTTTEIPDRPLGVPTVSSEAFTLESRYHPVMFCGFLGGNEMVVVERPTLKVYEELPEAFWKKEFQW